MNIQFGVYLQKNNIIIIFYYCAYMNTHIQQNHYQINLKNCKIYARQLDELINDPSTK